MAIINVIMPKLGESIMEATVLKLHKQVGDHIQLDDVLMDIATDKVDSEVPSTAEGVLEEYLCRENDIISIGSVIARIRTKEDVETDHGSIQPARSAGTNHKPVVEEQKPVIEEQKSVVEEQKPVVEEQKEIQEAEIPYQPSVYAPLAKQGPRFYSPLVMNIAAQEGIPLGELEHIQGTGNEGRLTKSDLLTYLSHRGSNGKSMVTETNHEAVQVITTDASIPSQTFNEQQGVLTAANVEVVEMDRMRKMISEHMTRSKATSAHVTSFGEADVTNMVKWRESVKKEFEKREGEKITYTPIFIEAIVRSLKKFPMLNSSVVGNNIIVKKDIHIGMATALPNGNLIVPVIKHADQLNIIGLTKQVNRLAGEAKKGRLQPADTQDGTFTFTNIGTFGSLMGTPIINQPQVAVLATGAIKKKPVVIESEKGDSIAIRHMMFVSMSYDHRIIDGGLGSAFLDEFVKALEGFNPDRSF
jgi:2-oxoglutarate dehydrogenase E2 component (dihydrolipoamide succinyltransferase)